MKYIASGSITAFFLLLVQLAFLQSAAGENPPFAIYEKSPFGDFFVNCKLKRPDYRSINSIGFFVSDGTFVPVAITGFSIKSSSTKDFELIYKTSNGRLLTIGNFLDLDRRYCSFGFAYERVVFNYSPDISAYVLRVNPGEYMAGIEVNDTGERVVFPRP